MRKQTAGENERTLARRARALAPNQMIAIHLCRRAGLTFRVIGEIFGCSTTLAHQLNQKVTVRALLGTAFAAQINGWMRELVAPAQKAAA